MRPQSRCQRAEMTTGRVLEEAQARDADDLDAGEVAERMNNAIVLGVHDERAAMLAVAAVAHLEATRVRRGRSGAGSG